MIETALLLITDIKFSISENTKISIEDKNYYIGYINAIERILINIT